MSSPKEKDTATLRLIKEKQAQGPASISIRFNAASVHDYDDDIGIVLPTPSPEEPSSSKLPTEPSSAKILTESQTSKVSSEPSTSKLPTKSQTSKLSSESSKLPTKSQTSKLSSESSKLTVESQISKLSSESMSSKLPTESQTSKLSSESTTSKRTREPENFKLPTVPQSSKPITVPQASKPATEPPSSNLPTSTYLSSIPPTVSASAPMSNQVGFDILVLNAAESHEEFLDADQDDVEIPTNGISYQRTETWREKDSTEPIEVAEVAYNDELLSNDANEVFLPPAPAASSPTESIIIPEPSKKQEKEDEDDGDTVSLLSTTSMDSKTTKKSRFSPLRHLKQKVEERRERELTRPSTPSTRPTTPSTRPTTPSMRPTSPLRRLQRGFKSRDADLKASTVAAVTMSQLLDKNKEEEEEEEDMLEEDGEQFFDPLEEIKTDKDSTAEPKITVTPPPSVFAQWGLNSAHLRQKLIALLVVVLASLVGPFPSYLSGMVLGLILGAGGMFIYQWIMIESPPKPEIKLEPIDKLPRLQVPEMRESSNEPGRFMGWLNELSHYEPDDYHISSTRSVYVQLEGTNLRLQTPKQPVTKRAMWNEPIQQKTTFIQQRFLELSSSKVYLLPGGLVKKRLWSKKYPICIELNLKENSKKSLPQHGSLDDLKLLDPAAEEDRNSVADELEFEVVHKSNKNGKLLYLFARTCREKEEWFRRLYAASKGTPLPTQMVGLLAKLAEQKSRTLSSNSDKESSNTSTVSSDAPPKATPIPHSATDSNLQGIVYSNTAVEPSSPLQLAQAQNTNSLPSFTLLSSPNEQQAPKELYIQYLRYMARLMPADSLDRFLASAGPNISRQLFQFEHLLQPNKSTQSLCDDTLICFNAVLGRVFWDFLREKYWADMVTEKIQRKLSKIHVPFFIDELTVTGIDLGTEIPTIRRITRPYIDDRGLWIDLDIAYTGGFTMSLETAVNLMKLKKKTPATQESKISLDSQCSISSLEGEAIRAMGLLDERRNAATNEDEEDSAESSTDEEMEDGQDQGAEQQDARIHSPTSNTSKKFLRLVDKIAASRYFQQATEYKYIKKAMEEVSNTRLMLKVDLKSLSGVLAINIPPPPTDRIWYGFRSNPSLYLSAKPQVGERTINVSHITDWIEKKLAIEFQRVLVFPNMDDLLLPIMCDEQTCPPSASSPRNQPAARTSTPDFTHPKSSNLQAPAPPKQASSASKSNSSNLQAPAPPKQASSASKQSNSSDDSIR